MIVFSLVIIGYNLQDTGLQDNIRTIQEENKNINTQNKLIEKSEISKIESNKKIEKAKEILKTKYSVTYQ